MKEISKTQFDYEHYASRLLQGEQREDVLWWKAKVLAGIVPQGFSFTSALEIGCAEGIVLNKLAALLHINKCYGLDVSETFLNEGRKRFPEIEFMQSQSETFPFADQSIDLVILSDIIEHIENLTVFFQEVRRVGKYILAKLPLEHYWWRTFVSLPLKRAPLPGQHHPDGHLHVFSKKTFLRFFIGMCFSIIADLIV